MKKPSVSSVDWSQFTKDLACDAFGDASAILATYHCQACKKRETWWANPKHFQHLQTALKWKTPWTFQSTAWAKAESVFLDGSAKATAPLSLHKPQGFQKPGWRTRSKMKQALQALCNPMPHMLEVSHTPGLKQFGSSQHGVIRREKNLNRFEAKASSTKHSNSDLCEVNNSFNFNWHPKVRATKIASKGNSKYFAFFWCHDGLGR